jgi:protein TonB
VVPQPKQSGWPPGFIRMSGNEFAASDIAGIKPSPDAADDSASGQSDTPLAEGHGPHGEPLYAADWLTRPTHAQINPYIPARAKESGWGLIACRTASGFRVEDCHDLDEEPEGSGLAEAVRQAAWQFRVRPPRVGRRDLVGAWVSIRIDYTITRAAP